MATSELAILEYQAQASEYAWFMDEPDPKKRHDTIYHGFTEEMDELLYDEKNPKELTAMLWGHAVLEPIKTELSQRAVSEVGDLLYYITAAGMLQEVSLATMIQGGIKAYTGKEEIACETFSSFDAHLLNKMKPPVSNDYVPDYGAIAFWDLVPLYRPESGRSLSNHTENIRGPLITNGDGRFTLERTLRTTSEWIRPEASWSTPLFVEKAGLALGALSTVAQNRLNSSLSQAAERNLAKLERRAQNKTTQSGADEERSRKPGEERIRLSGWDVTLLSLVYSESPDAPST